MWNLVNLILASSRLICPTGQRRRRTSNQGTLDPISSAARYTIVNPVNWPRDATNTLIVSSRGGTQLTQSRFAKSDGGTQIVNPARNRWPASRAATTTRNLSSWRNTPSRYYLWKRTHNTMLEREEIIAVWAWTEVKWKEKRRRQIWVHHKMWQPRQRDICSVLKDLGRNEAKIFNCCRMSVDCMRLLSNHYKKKKRDRKYKKTCRLLPATDSLQ